MVTVSPRVPGPLDEAVNRPEGFGAVFDAYFPEIHRYIARRLGPDIADELAAETFTIGFCRRGSYDRGRGGVRPWLFGIATNLIAKHRRLEARKFRALARLGADPSFGIHEDQVAEQIGAEETRPRLASALAALSPRLREVLLLVVLGELTYEEVSQALGIPYGTVCSRFNRARGQVREALGGINPMLDEEELLHG